jgi:hypothetical protein
VSYRGCPCKELAYRHPSHCVARGGSLEGSSRSTDCRRPSGRGSRTIASPEADDWKVVAGEIPRFRRLGRGGDCRNSTFTARRSTARATHEEAARLNSLSRTQDRAHQTQIRSITTTTPRRPLKADSHKVHYAKNRPIRHSPVFSSRYETRPRHSGPSDTSGGPQWPPDRLRNS